MHRFMQADGLVADTEPAVAAGQGDADVELVEIGLASAEIIGLHRRDDPGVEDLEIGRDRLVDPRRRDTQPAGRGKLGFPDMVGMDAVGREDFVFAGPAGRVGQLDTVDRRIAGFGHEGQFGIADHCRQRIGFEAEALGRGVGEDGIMHNDLADALELDFFKKEMHQRFVGAAQSRLDARFRELPFGALAGGLVFEEPRLDEAGRLEREEAFDEGIKGTRRGQVEYDGHLLPWGSR